MHVVVRVRLAEGLEDISEFPPPRFILRVGDVVDDDECDDGLIEGDAVGVRLGEFRAKEFDVGVDFLLEIEAEVDEFVELLDDVVD